MGAPLRMPEAVVDAFDHLVGERIAKLIGALVRLGARVAHEIGQQPFDDPVLPHDTLGPLAARPGEQRLFPLAALDQPVGLETLQHLPGRGA